MKCKPIFNSSENRESNAENEIQGEQLEALWKLFRRRSLFQLWIARFVANLKNCICVSLLRFYLKSFYYDKKCIKDYNFMFILYTFFSIFIIFFYFKMIKSVALFSFDIIDL